MNVECVRDAGFWTARRAVGAVLVLVVVVLAGVGVWVLATQWAVTERPEMSGRFGTPAITLDVDALPSADCWYEVTLTDDDGEPGGRKTAHIEPLCP